MKGDETMTRNYYVVVNTYRSSTDNGFANTWCVALCANKSVQRRILDEGLPVHDVCDLDHNGRRTTVYSTMGVRAATPAERREARRRIDSGDYLEVIE
jgi:hypothetical protein